MTQNPYIEARRKLRRDLSEINQCLAYAAQNLADTATRNKIGLADPDADILKLGESQKKVTEAVEIIFYTLLSLEPEKE